MDFQKNFKYDRNSKWKNKYPRKRLGFKHIITFRMKLLMLTFKKNLKEKENFKSYYYKFGLYAYTHRFPRVVALFWSISNWSFFYIQRALAQKVGFFKKGRGLLRYFNMRYFKSRYLKSRAQGGVRNYRYMRFMIDKEYNQLVYRGHNRIGLGKPNNFFIRNFDKRNLLKLIWTKYLYMKSWRPFSYVQKKYKLYFNWADRLVFQRFPLYRRKYQVLFYYPTYQDYRYLFKNQLTHQHLFRWLFRLKYKQLVKKFKKAVLKTKRVFELMFLNFFEMRMDVLIYRLNFAFSVKQAKQWVNRSFFKVNSKNIAWYSYHVNIGDIIMPINNLRLAELRNTKWVFTAGLYYLNMRLFLRHVQMDQYPSHLFINERIPAGMVTTMPDINQVRFHRPWSVQYITLSLNKYS